MILEFVKGQGGVVNIVNGNLKDSDRNELLNIEDVDRVRIAMPMGTVAYNDSQIAMQISGFIILFDDLYNMQVYVDQIRMVSGEIINPGVDGIQKPDWDVASRNKTEGIQSHEYEDTDIEKKLIEGD